MVYMSKKNQAMHLFLGKNVLYNIIMPVVIVNYLEQLKINEKLKNTIIILLNNIIYKNNF